MLTHNIALLNIMTPIIATLKMTTRSIKILNIITLEIITLSITILSITRLGIMILSINDNKQNIFTVMLNVFIAEFSFVIE